MRMLLFAVALVFLMAAPTVGVDRPAVPKGPPPNYAIATLGKGGALLLEKTVTVPVTEKRVRVKEVNGRKVEETYSVVRYAVQRVTYQQLFKTIDVYNAAGEKLDAEDARDELKKRQTVLVSTNGEKVAPFYLSIVKPSTLVIVDRSRKSKRKGPTPARPK